MRWCSSDDSIATVNPDSGLVTGQGVGTVVITATAVDRGIVTGTYVIEIVPYVFVQSLTVLNPELTMHPDERERVNILMTPSNATNFSVKWCSSNECVATVDSLGVVKTHNVGETIITVRTTDGSNLCATCRVIVEPVPVEAVTIESTSENMNIGDEKEIVATICPENATNKTIKWHSTNENVVTVGTYTGKVTAHKAGTAEIVATTVDGNFVARCMVIVNRYRYELINLCGFSEDEADMIISLYSKIDEIYSCETALYRAWRCARLLSEFCYDDVTSFKDIIHINKWDDTAGSVTTNEDRQSYFINTLGYSECDYIKIRDSLQDNHKKAGADGEFLDFCHMQYSLAARLAYALNLDGGYSNWGTGYYTEILKKYTDEEISYFAGWLGDAVLKGGDGKTTFRNDDYMSDIDAENIYRLMIQGNSSVNVFSNYYISLTSNYTRADNFLTYISYETVCDKVYSELKIENENEPMNIVKNNYPDTYNFLKSLNECRATMLIYQ